MPSLVIVNSVARANPPGHAIVSNHEEEEADAIISDVESGQVFVDAGVYDHVEQVAVEIPSESGETVGFPRP